MGANPSPHIATTDPRIAEVNRVLIGGQGQPADPLKAIGILQALAQSGVGAAAERLAVIAAMGVARPSNWIDALNWLVKAAELGHAPAQVQLAVLVGWDQPPAETGADAWKQLARRIDIKRMLKAPALTRVKDSPSIALIEGPATPAMCRWLIARGAAKVEPAKIGDYGSGEWVRDQHRTGEAAGFGLADTDLIFVLTQKRLELASGLAVHQQEAPHILSYEPGQEYRPHYDFLLPEEPAFAHILEAMGQRVATCLTWLNADYEGGETAFLKIDWKHKAQPGDAMLFLNVRTSDRKPDPMSLHAGLPVTSGRKWLLSQWVRDKIQPIV